MTVGDRLQAALLDAGVAVEQIGLADGVLFEVDDQGTITLGLGEDSEEAFDDVTEALARIEEYGEEFGGDGSRPGAIIDFVAKLEKLVARVPAEKKLDALVERFDDVEAIAEKVGLEHVRKVYIDDLEVMADDDGDIGFFEDGNQVLWRVYFDGVEYIVFDRDQ